MSKEDGTIITGAEIARVNGLLFTDRVATLPFEARLGLTGQYIGYFIYRQVDDLMIAQAELTQEEIERILPSEKSFLTDKGRHPATIALERRVNFVQMLRQQEGTAPLYSSVKHIYQIRRANLNYIIRSNGGNWPDSDTQAKIFDEPFYYDATLNMIKHYDPDTPADIKSIQQLNRLLQQLFPIERHPGYYMPDPEWLGVVLLNK